MLRASTIVCDFDASYSSERSLPLAVNMAKAAGSKLVLVHVVPSHTLSFYTAITLNMPREIAWARGKVEPMVKKLMAENPEVEMELRVVGGYREDVLETVAKETGADLIVSARHWKKLTIEQNFAPEKKAAGLETVEAGNTMMSVTETADAGKLKKAS